MASFVFVTSFVAGLVFGSFFNVVGLRVPAKQSVIRPRSACPRCRRPLTAGELIPVLSYIVQRGKCRTCGAKISPIYPAVELVTGLLFATAPFFVGWSGDLLIALTLISLFMIIVVSDLAYMIIPDKILLIFAGIFFIERIFMPLTPWWDSLLGALLGFSVLFLIAVISKGGMGGGDIKLFTLIGFATGVKTLTLSFLLSVFLGAVFGVIGLAFKFVSKGKPIPFGPFIAAGTLISYYFGDWIVEKYIYLFSGGF